MGASRIMERRRVGSLFMVAMRFLVLSGMFLGCFSASNQPIPSGLGNSLVFTIHGNVYPQGFYYVSLYIGNPPKPYFLDIDSGSDLTWLQCDAPCISCIKGPHKPYKPNKNIVKCNDPMCSALYWPSRPPCKSPQEQCDYEVKYADHGSSLGVLVNDFFSLPYGNGSVPGPSLTFGCGYDQNYPGPNAPFTDGVLGLGYGKSSIVTQLKNLGMIRSVVGHCLSGQGGGFLSLGDGFSDIPGMIWTPMSMSRKSGENTYLLGPADLLFNGQSSGVKGLSLVFDSGSSYTYFNAQAYKTTLSLLRKSVNGKLKETADETLPVCWKGPQPFRHVSEAKNYFKPLALSFTKAKTQLQLSPESYLIISKHGNACLGILNGSEIGLGDSNLIGDISFQDKMVIYDNERQLIGWAAKDCNRPPKDGRDYNKGFSPADLGKVVEQFSAAYESREEL